MQDEGLWRLRSILIYILMTNIQHSRNITWFKGQGKHNILSKRSANLVLSYTQILPIRRRYT